MLPPSKTLWHILASSVMMGKCSQRLSAYNSIVRDPQCCLHMFIVSPAFLRVLMQPLQLSQLHGGRPVCKPRLPASGPGASPERRAASHARNHRSAATQQLDISKATPIYSGSFVEWRMPTLSGDACSFVGNGLNKIVLGAGSASQCHLLTARHTPPERGPPLGPQGQKSPR